MRTLYYVPIIHTSADMGSLARAVTERGINQVGERNWERHVATIRRFWDRIAEYCASLPAEGMKIYQDGLVAEGEIGAKIISAGAFAIKRLGQESLQIIIGTDVEHVADTIKKQLSCKKKVQEYERT